MLQEDHSAILWTFMELHFVIEIFVLSIFERPFYTGFTVHSKRITVMRTPAEESTGDKNRDRQENS